MASHQTTANLMYRFPRLCHLRVSLIPTRRCVRGHSRFLHTEEGSFDEFTARLETQPVQKTLSLPKPFHPAFKGTGPFKLHEDTDTVTFSGTPTEVAACYDALVARLARLQRHRDYLIVSHTHRQLSGIKTKIENMAGVFYHHDPLEDQTRGTERFAKVHVVAETAQTLYQAMDAAKLLLRSFQRKFTLTRAARLALTALALSEAPVETRQVNPAELLPNLYLAKLGVQTHIHAFFDTHSLLSETHFLVVTSTSRIGYIEAVSLLVQKVASLHATPSHTIELPPHIAPSLSSSVFSGMWATLTAETGSKLTLWHSRDVSFATLANHRLDQLDTAVNRLGALIDTTAQNAQVLRLPQSLVPFFTGYRGVELEAMSNVTETHMQMDQHRWQGVAADRVHILEGTGPFASLLINTPLLEHARVAMRVLKAKGQSLAANTHTFHIPARFYEALRGDREASKLAELEFLTDTTIHMHLPVLDQAEVAIYGDALQAERVAKVIQLRLDAFNAFSYPMYLPRSALRSVKRISDASHTVTFAVLNPQDHARHLTPYGTDLIQFNPHARTRRAPFEGVYIVVYAETSDDLITAMTEFLQLKAVHCLKKPL